MVVEILVSQCQAVDTLGDQVIEVVLDQLGIAVVGKAGRELLNDAGENFGLAK